MRSKHGFETTIERSLLMTKIKSTNTKAEILLRKALWNLGYRYRINVSSLPGKPDIVFENRKLVIFIDGEFWHGYNWEEKRLKIKSNREYWIKKIEGNIRRDIDNVEKLEKMNYTVIRFWERDIVKNFNKCVEQILITIDNYNKQESPLSQ